MNYKQFIRWWIHYVTLRFIKSNN